MSKPQPTHWVFTAHQRGADTVPDSVLVNDTRKDFRNKQSRQRNIYTPTPLLPTGHCYEDIMISAGSPSGDHRQPGQRQQANRLRIPKQKRRSLGPWWSCPATEQSPTCIFFVRKTISSVFKPSLVEISAAHSQSHSLLLLTFPGMAKSCTDARSLYLPLFSLDWLVPPHLGIAGRKSQILAISFDPYLLPLAPEGVV